MQQDVSMDWSMYSSVNDEFFTSGYVSCIKVDGAPILPPIMTDAVREEMRQYKALAIAKDKRIKSRLNTVSGTMELSNATDCGESTRQPISTITSDTTSLGQYLCTASPDPNRNPVLAPSPSFPNPTTNSGNHASSNTDYCTPRDDIDTEAIIDDLSMASALCFSRHHTHSSEAPPHREIEDEDDDEVTPRALNSLNPSSNSGSTPIPHSTNRTISPATQTGAFKPTVFTTGTGSQASPNSNHNESQTTYLASNSEGHCLASTVSKSKETSLVRSDSFSVAEPSQALLDSLTLTQACISAAYENPGPSSVLNNTCGGTQLPASSISAGWTPNYSKVGQVVVESSATKSVTVETSGVDANIRNLATITTSARGPFQQDGFERLLRDERVKTLDDLMAISTNTGVGDAGGVLNFESLKFQQCKMKQNNRNNDLVVVNPSGSATSASMENSTDSTSTVSEYAFEQRAINRDINDCTGNNNEGKIVRDKTFDSNGEAIPPDPSGIDSLVITDRLLNMIRQQEVSNIEPELVREKIDECSSIKQILSTYHALQMEALRMKQDRELNNLEGQINELASLLMSEGASSSNNGPGDTLDWVDAAILEAPTPLSMITPKKARQSTESNRSHSGASASLDARCGGELPRPPNAAFAVSPLLMYSPLNDESSPRVLGGQKPKVVRRKPDITKRTKAPRHRCTWNSASTLALQTRSSNVDRHKGIYVSPVRNPNAPSVSKPANGDAGHLLFEVSNFRASPQGVPATNINQNDIASISDTNSTTKVKIQPINNKTNVQQMTQSDGPTYYSQSSALPQLQNQHFSNMASTQDQYTSIDNQLIARDQQEKSESLQSYMYDLTIWDGSKSMSPKPSLSSQRSTRIREHCCLPECRPSSARQPHCGAGTTGVVLTGACSDPENEKRSLKNEVARERHYSNCHHKQHRHHSQRYENDGRLESSLRPADGNKYHETKLQYGVHQNRQFLSRHVEKKLLSSEEEAALRQQYQGRHKFEQHLNASQGLHRRLSHRNTAADCDEITPIDSPHRNKGSSRTKLGHCATMMTYRANETSADTQQHQIPQAGHRSQRTRRQSHCDPSPRLQLMSPASRLRTTSLPPFRQQVPRELKMQLGAFIKGHLTRRVLKSPQMLHLRTIIIDVSNELDCDMPSNAAGSEMDEYRSRLCNQIASAKQQLWETMFVLPTSTRMQLVANLRERQRLERLNCTNVGDDRRLSAATVRAQLRRQNRSAPGTMGQTTHAKKLTKDRLGISRVSKSLKSQTNRYSVKPGTQSSPTHPGTLFRATSAASSIQQQSSSVSSAKPWR